MKAEAALAVPSKLFLSADEAAQVRERFGTPCYVYDRATLEAAADRALAFPNAFGVNVRYAMKANPNRALLEIFREKGLDIDASSDFEVDRALRAGFAPGRIMLTSQVPSPRLRQWVDQGVLYNACSLHQLERYGQLFPGRDVTIRVNPGEGSGATHRVNTGGPTSSFGIWHEHLGEAISIAAAHQVTLRGLHTHIGSGSDPAVWTRVARLVLEIAERLPDVRTVSLGGGYKVARIPGDSETDLHTVGESARAAVLDFEKRTGRALRLEIEPGTYLVANAGIVVASCVDVVDTGPNGFCFAKVDSGMTEVMRASLYGAQHPIEILAAGRPQEPVVFVGRCCETGDMLTPASGDTSKLAPREVPHPKIGDLVLIGGAGAYCAAMSTINYNSYPAAPEVLRERDGTLRLVRRRQTVEEMIAAETP